MAAALTHSGCFCGKSSAQQKDADRLAQQYFFSSCLRTRSTMRTRVNFTFVAIQQQGLLDPASLKSLTFDNMVIT